jgi:hypothetical protein
MLNNYLFQKIIFIRIDEFNYIIYILTQMNVFTCGGIAISLCISHNILDGASLSTFLMACMDTNTNPITKVERKEWTNL